MAALVHGLIINYLVLLAGYLNKQTALHAKLNWLDLTCSLSQFVPMIFLCTLYYITHN